MARACRPQHRTALCWKRASAGGRGAGPGPTPHNVGARELTAECASCEAGRAAQSGQDSEGGDLLPAGYSSALATAGGTCLVSEPDVTAEKNATSLQGLKDRSFLG